MNEKSSRRSGGCLCGAVRFEVDVPEAKFSACHCGMCRRWSAGPYLSVHCPGEATFSNDEGLEWWAGSIWAERGFCKRCGASLFYRLRQNPSQMIIVSSEALDEADDLVLDRHIYVDAKPDRYDFADDRPRLTEADFLAEQGLNPDGSPKSP